jgi:hypothetical protein
VGYVSTYFLCDPLAVLPSPEGNVESPWKVLIEVASNDPNTFLTAVRLTSLEALRVRLGDGFYVETMRKLTEQPPRSVPTDRQHHVRGDSLGDEHGVWNGLRYWFTDRLSERGADDSWG